MFKYDESYFFGTSREYSRYGPKYYLGNDCLTLAKKLYTVIKNEETSLQKIKNMRRRAVFIPSALPIRNLPSPPSFSSARIPISTNALPSDDDIFEYYFKNNINKRSRSEPEFIKYLNLNVINTRNTINKKIKEPLKDFLEIIKGNLSQYYLDNETLFNSVLIKLDKTHNL